MRVSRSKLRNNYLYIIITVIIGILVIAYFITRNGIRLNRETSERFSNYYLNEQKAWVKREVENRVDQIEYEIAENELQRQQELKFWTVYMWELLLQTDIIDVYDVDRRREKALDEFNRLVDDNEERYFFAVSPDGILLRSESDDSLEGENVYDYQDFDGKYFFREILKAVDNSEGIKVSYYWPKETEGEPQMKIAYCLYLPEFDIIIGTGYYVEEAKVAIQEKVYTKLQEYYEDSGEYIFVTDYDSTSRVSGNPDLIGTKLDYFVDTDGTFIHDIFMDGIAEDGEGFVNYVYYKKNNGELVEKISFVKGFDEWQVYIGMGFYVDDLNSEITSYSEEFKSDKYEEVLITILILVVLGVIILVLVKRGQNLQKLYLRQEEMVFTQVLELLNDGIIVVSKKGEILYKNTIAEKMIGDNITKYAKYAKNGKLTFEEVKEDTYSIINQKGREYFAQINIQEIIYHGVDSMIYFINDVTDSYIQTNEFKQLALVDELTDLPNRRKLNDDFEDMCYNKNESKNIVITMIDLDYFKVVNDTYGHDVGDQVIKLLAKSFNARLRNVDAFYRYGGEEFVVILKDVNLEESKKILESINETFNQMVHYELKFNATFSGGSVLVDWNDELYNIRAVLKEADLLLYQAKNKGRNRIEIYYE